MNAQIGRAVTNHGIRSRPLRETRDVCRAQAQDYGEIRGEGHLQAEACEACPDAVGIDLPDHCGADEGYAEVGDDEVGARVGEVAGAESRGCHENELEGGADHLHQQGGEGGEAEAADDDGGELECSGLELATTSSLYRSNEWKWHFLNLRSEQLRWRRWSQAGSTLAAKS